MVSRKFGMTSIDHNDPGPQLQFLCGPLFSLPDHLFTMKPCYLLESIENNPAPHQVPEISQPRV